MMYVLNIMWGALAGGVSGWLFYNALMGAKKDRMRGAILWGMGIGIICFICAVGG